MISNLLGLKVKLEFGRFIRKPLSYPAWVGPSSPDISTRQSFRILSVLSMAAKNLGPMDTSREVMASPSSSFKVKWAKNNVTIDFRVSTSCLRGQLKCWRSERHVTAYLSLRKLPARSSKFLLASFVNCNCASASSHLDRMASTWDCSSFNFCML